MLRLLVVQSVDSGSIRSQQELLWLYILVVEIELIYFHESSLRVQLHLIDDLALIMSVLVGITYDT